MPAHAQQPLDAADYKAAYCVGRLRDLRPPQPTASNPAAANEMMSKLSEKIDSARTRLRSYLLPRLAYLDGTAIFATMQIGVNEEQQYEGAMRSCAAKLGAPDFTACANDAGWPKLKECEEATFLPF